MLFASWKELRAIALRCGWVESRIKGDHLVITRAGQPRPVVIKMDRSLGEDIIRTNLRTMGVSRTTYEKMLTELRGHRKAKKKGGKSK